MTPELRHRAIAAAWAAWHERHGGKLGPGPAFTEAIDAALAVILKGTTNEPAENPPTTPDRP